MWPFKKKKLDKEEVVSEKPQTSGYQSWPMNYLSSTFEQRPLFNIFQADLMRVDHQVAFGHAVSNGPLMTAKVIVDAPRPDVKQFVTDQWERFWHDSAGLIMRNKAYGFIAGEIMYKESKEGIEFDRLLDRHPRDTRPLIKKGQMVGLRVYNCGGTTTTNQNASAINLRPHKAFWFSYGSEFGSRWGKPLYEKAYDPWYEKRMQGGAIPLRRLRMIKDAWIGDVFRVPFAEPLRKPDGTEFSFRDVAREMQDLRMSGGGMVLPSDKDGEGNYKVDYTPPSAVAGATQIMEWVDALDWDIWDAFYIPKEVIEAAETGSGYSGRQLPFEAFLTVRDEEFKDIVRQAKPQIMERLVAMRFGADAAREFDIKPQSMVEEFRKQQNSESEDKGKRGEPQDPAAQAEDEQNKQPSWMNQPRMNGNGKPKPKQPAQFSTENDLHSDEIAAELVGAGILDAADLVKAARSELKRRRKVKK